MRDLTLTLRNHVCSAWKVKWGYRDEPCILSSFLPYYLVNSIYFFSCYFHFSYCSLQLWLCFLLSYSLLKSIL